jgi:spermidine synthase
MMTESSVPENGPRPAMLSAVVSARWVMAIFFFSGMCALIDEVIWCRLLKLTLGNTVYASTIVVSVFMGGLALGALVMGRYADRVPRPLRLYALLEIGVAAITVILPAAFGAADGLYRFLFVKFQSSPEAISVAQIVVSSCILLVPTMLMGSTLPLLGRFVTVLEERIGSSVGRLYAINTLGAAIGCFLAGFVLIRTMGVLQTLYAAAGLNALVALAGWLLSRKGETLSRDAVKNPDERLTVANHPAERFRWLLGAIFFASGCISIGYELVWMRSVVIPLGGFTYVFSAVLTVYLLGNVIGAWIGSRLSRKLRTPALGASICLLLLGACGLFFMPWLVHWLTPLFAWSKSLLLPMSQQTWLWVAGRPLLYSCVLFLLPAIIMGIGFPLALSAWNRYTPHAGRTTGSVYGINTIGAIAGGIFTGFILIPWCGAQKSIVALGMAGIILGAGGIQAFCAPGARVKRLAYGVAALALVVCGFLLPSDLFTKKIVAIPGLETVAVCEGATATVSVTRRPQDGAMELTSDGLRIAGDDIHRSAQQILGNIGVLLHPKAERVLSVGFGSGETVKCLSRYPLQKIDCVEIAPELIDLATRYFRHINRVGRSDATVSIIAMDAYNFLHVTDRTYDVIVNDANLPSHSGCAPLFTKEHFRNCANRLNPRGLFITKLPLADLSESTFNSILGTFRESFPHVTLWFPVTRPYIFFYLIGSREEILFSPASIDAMLAADTVRAASEFLRYRTSHDVLSCYIADEKDLSRSLTSYRPNSNNKPFVEFNIDQNPLPTRLFFRNFTNKIRSSSLYKHIDWTGFSPERKNRWIADQLAVDEATSGVLQSFSEDDIWRKLSICSKGLRSSPDNPALLEEEEFILSEAQRILSSNPSAPIGDVARSMISTDSSSADGWILLSWALQVNRDFPSAMAAAQTAVARSPASVAARDNFASILLQMQAYDKVIGFCDTTTQLAPDRTRSRILRASALYAKGQVAAAIEEFSRVVRLDPRDASSWRVLGDLYRDVNERARAEQAYREALRINPNETDAKNGLSALGLQ